MIEGSCHCGAISLRLDADPQEAIECNCSHCSRKGYVFAFVPREQLKVSASEDAIGTYTFNRHAIAHHFCRTCGSAPYAEAESEKGPTAAVNLRCFEVDLDSLNLTKVDGRSF